MKRVRTALVPLLVWGVATFAVGSIGGEDKLDPDAISLMQSVEKARTQTQPFRVKGKYLQKYRGELISQCDFEVAFDQGKYRVQVKYPIPEASEIIATSIFDGAQFLSYDPITDDDPEDKTIFDPAREQSCMFFDPRLIGISRSLCTDSRFSPYLSFHSASLVKLGGADEITGSAAKIVTINERSGRQVQFWIDSEKSFRVVKHSVVYPIERGGSDSKTVTESEFWAGAADEWFPRKVRMVTYETDEETRITSEQVLEFGRPLRPAHISPDTWTLKGLGMPPDRIVLNPQTKMRIGYWDGEKLTLDPVEKP
jgi:hypothetical protein